MNLFWGADLTDQTQGLDILGVRGLDQAVEGALVNGITTISQRGRYLTLLPWALGEFFKSELAAGDAEFDDRRLQGFLRRVEFLVLAATSLDSDAGEAGGGALGSDLNSELIQKLRTGAAVDFPTDTGGAMLGTYYGPCRALGLLADGGGGAPFHLTSRGRKVWEARRATLGQSKAAQAVVAATPLTKQLVDGEILQFSLAKLAAAGQEAALLEEALQQAWEPEGTNRGKEQVAAAYARFGDTVSWIRHMLADGPAKPEEMLARNMKTCCDGHHFNLISIQWAEYEWRRRCHFALELLLAAVCAHLAAVGDSNIPDLIQAWRNDADVPGENLWPAAVDAWAISSAAAFQSVPKDAFLGATLSVRLLREQRSSQQALSAIALLVAMQWQSALVRKEGLFTNRSGPGDSAIAAVSSAGDEPFDLLLRRIVETCVIVPHLTNTLRKMSAGQKCSLRFFPDGPVLRSTGIRVQPGHSGDRLSNVMRVLADVGILIDQPGGRYSNKEKSA